MLIPVALWIALVVEFASTFPRTQNATRAAFCNPLSVVPDLTVTFEVSVKYKFVAELTFRNASNTI